MGKITSEAPVLDTLVAMNGSRSRAANWTRTPCLPCASQLWWPSMRPQLPISCTSARRWTPASRPQQVQDILIAVAPIVGTPRTASAAAKITEAVGIVIVALEEEFEAEEQAQ